MPAVCHAEACLRAPSIQLSDSLRAFDSGGLSGEPCVLVHVGLNLIFLVPHEMSGLETYARELSSALALAGVDCDVYTRACEPGLPDVVEVEPGFRVHSVVAGPCEPVAKEQLPELVSEFTVGVRRRMETALATPGLIHANYWLSGVAGHELEHALPARKLAQVPGDTLRFVVPRRADLDERFVR